MFTFEYPISSQTKIYFSLLLIGSSMTRYLTMKCLVSAAPPFGWNAIKVVTPATVLVYVNVMQNCHNNSCKPAFGVTASQVII